MKTKYTLLSLLACVCLVFTSCEGQLDISQHGVVSQSDFYQTDDDAEEAIVACYDAWLDSFFEDVFLKYFLGDECYAGGDNWTVGSCYLVTTMTFNSEYDHVLEYFSDMYTVVYRANVILDNVEPDTDIKARAVAEARVFRALAYIELISLWGTPPLVDHVLGADEYYQGNCDTETLWAFVEEDLTTAIESGYLTEKSSVSDWTYRVTKQFAQALLGKAYVYQEEWSSAISVLEEVIDSGLYALVDDFSNVWTTRGECSTESLFELNIVMNLNDVFSSGDISYNYLHWRADMLDFDNTLECATYDQTCWGFLNPTKEAYDRFVAWEGEDGYRLNNSIKTYEQMQEIGVTVSSTIAYMPDNAGLFPWKYRVYADDIVFYYYAQIPDNVRVMRYADVLLLAAEACVQSGNSSKALTYVNEVRDRAQLDALTSVDMDVIMNERFCELFEEGNRWQDIIRWGVADELLADRGKERPALYADGTVDWTLQTNSSAGWNSDKFWLLPFPGVEVNSNPNIEQNPGW